MRSFKDRNGKEWTVSLDIPTVEQISKIEGLDRAMVLRDPSKFMELLMGDEFLLGDALQVACLEQCQRENITVEQFVKLFAGESLDQACKVFLEEYVDFFRDPVKRRGLRMVLDKTAAYQEKALAMVEARLNDPKTDAAIVGMIETLGENFTDSLERSVQIPAASPTGT